MRAERNDGLFSHCSRLLGGFFPPSGHQRWPVSALIASFNWLAQQGKGKERSVGEPENVLSHFYRTNRGWGIGRAIYSFIREGPGPQKTLQRFLLLHVFSRPSADVSITFLTRACGIKHHSSRDRFRVGFGHSRTGPGPRNNSVYYVPSLRRNHESLYLRALRPLAYHPFTMQDYWWARVFAWPWPIGNPA